MTMTRADNVKTIQRENEIDDLLHAWHYNYDGDLSLADYLSAYGLSDVEIAAAVNPDRNDGAVI
jgi:hypothetical protein